MPTYDYRCKSCGHEFELFQSMTEGTRRKCPDCGRLTLERLIGTGAAVLFKGSGFYETDYRSDSYKRGAKAAEQSQDGASGEKKAGGESKGDGAKSADAKSADAKSSDTKSSDTKSSGKGSGGEKGGGGPQKSD